MKFMTKEDCMGAPIINISFIEKGVKSYEPTMFRNFENLVRRLMGDA